MDLREEAEKVNWFQLASEKDWCQALVNAVMNLWLH
jgi:hypothetical protein